MSLYSLGVLLALDLTLAIVVLSIALLHFLSSLTIFFLIQPVYRVFVDLANDELHVHAGIYRVQGL